MGILLLGMLIYGLMAVAFISFLNSWMKDEPLTNITTITQYGDTFVDAISLSGALHSNTETEIIHKLYWTSSLKEGKNFVFNPTIKNKTSALSVRNSQRNTSVKIAGLASINGINYYLVVDQYLVWVKNNAVNYNYIDLQSVKWFRKDECKDLFPLAQKMLATGDWKWYHVCALFLLNNDDRETIIMTKRYANNQFTAKELAANADSLFQRSDIVKYANELKQQIPNDATKP